jgi:hypothetical protein
MIRPAEQYRQMADNYDRMALAMNDEALRRAYLDFAQQWRGIAEQAETLDVTPSKLSRRWSSANIS